MIIGQQTLASKYAEIASTQPDQIAILAEDLELTTAKLWRVAQSYASMLTEHGVVGGQIVALDTTDTIVSVASILATSLLGIVLVPYHPALFHEESFVISNVLRSVERPRDASQEELVIDSSWSPRNRDFSPIDPLRSDSFSGTDLAWVMPSSGTTGTPKYVGLSSNLVVSRVNAVLEDFESSHQRCLILFAAATRPFIIRAMAVLLSGRTIIDTRSYKFGARIMTDIVFASPNQLDTFLGKTTLLPKWSAVQISGAKLLPTTRARYLDSFQHVDDVYGTNETIKAQIIRYERGAEGEKERMITVNSEIGIVDTSGHAVPDGKEGEVRIRTPQMAGGYLNDAKNSRLCFRDGWFYPGDVGHKQPDGRVVLTGRLGDLLNIGGEKLSAQELEACLENTPGISGAICFENSCSKQVGELAAVLEVPVSTDARNVAIAGWKVIAANFGSEISPRSVLTVPELSKTHDGVVRRAIAINTFKVANEAPYASEASHQLFNFRIEPNA